MGTISGTRLASRAAMNYPSGMSSASQKLLDEALGLSEDERLELATNLIASVDGPPDAGWDDAWAAELERRADAAAKRGTPAPEWHEVRARILGRLSTK